MLKTTTGIHSHLIIITAKSQGLGHAEVTDLGKVLIDEQDVACGKISVDEVFALEVLHSLPNLEHELQHSLHWYITGLKKKKKECGVIHQFNTLPSKPLI